ncbi:hypothetical protein ACE6H2_014911 [Prunus campanulata]
MAPKGDNVIVSSINLEKILSMKGGKGELSYAKNSKSQAEHARSMLPLLKETLDRVQLSSREAPFVVVDLGCSSGSNTIYTIDVIIKHMAKRYESLGYHPPEFSALFSDLPSNDFNTLFQFLPPMANQGGSMEETVAADIHRSYFAAGVPGSFYRRLFPSRSIDVFHSAFSLHWLSQHVCPSRRDWAATNILGHLFFAISQSSPNSLKLFSKPSTSAVLVNTIASNAPSSILSTTCLAHPGPAHRVPESVLDVKSAAYNKGRVFIHGANESTANAYKKQFQTDLASFLRSRAKELKKGGSMFLVCLGRTSVDPTDQSGLGLLLGTYIQGAWDDLVQEQQQHPQPMSDTKFREIVKKLDEGLLRHAHTKDDYMNMETLESRLHNLIKRPQNQRQQYRQLVISSSPIGTMIPTPGMSHNGNSNMMGLINSEKRDSFNIPVYASSLQDFREVVEANGSFTINKLEIFKGGSPIVVNQPDDAAEVGRALANTCRSATGVLIDAHIGEHLGNELFSRVEQRSSRHAKELLEHIQMFYIVASISLA